MERASSQAATTSRGVAPPGGMVVVVDGAARVVVVSSAPPSPPQPERSIAQTTSATAILCTPRLYFRSRSSEPDTGENPGGLTPAGRSCSKTAGGAASV